MEYKSELEFKLRYDKNIPISEVLFRINQQLEYYEHFIIVEGTGDIVFYGNSNILNGINKPKIISAPSQQVDETVGKKYVINSYQLIKKSRLGKEMFKYIFIVDHDFTGINKYYNILTKSFEELSELDKKCISYTKCYAIENYFLEKENLKKIFTIFNIIDKYEEFYNMYINFIKETKELFALIATLMLAIENGIKINKLKYRLNDIFRFNFKNKYIYDNREYVYDREKYIEATKERLEAIKLTKQKKELYKKKKEFENFIEEKNYIQGHTAYNFLKEYITTVAEEKKVCIDIEPKFGKNDYIRILKDIEIDIELKYGNGKKVNNIKN